MPITGLNHVGLSTPDMARTLAFYRDGLGFSEIVSFSWEAGTPGADAGLGLKDTAAEISVLIAGNAYLEVLHFKNPVPIYFDQPPTLNRQGISHIGLSVREIPTAVELITSLGGGVIDQSTQTSQLVTDPDGNIIELHVDSAHDPLNYQALRTVVPAVSTGEPNAFTSPSRSVVTGLSFAGVTAVNAQELMDFYQVAGIHSTHSHQWSSPAEAQRAGQVALGSGGSHVLDLSNAYLEILEPARANVLGKPASARIIEYGFNHLCFDVADIASTHADLSAVGMRCFADWTNMPGGTSAMGYALDPAGNPIELLQHLSASSLMWPGHLSI